MLKAEGIGNLAIGSAKLANGAVTAAKLAGGAVGKAQLEDWKYVGAVSDIGHLYTCGRWGLVEVHCKKTAALAAWKDISGTLPGGIKAKRTARAALACEDKPSYIATAVIYEGEGTFRLYNRGSSDWPVSSGFYIVGQLLFQLA